MTRYLLDTNHLGLAVRPSSPVRQRIRRVHAEGGRFGTCIPVLCELEIGIRQVVLTDSQLGHRRVTIGDGSVLERPISRTDAIVMHASCSFLVKRLPDQKAGEYTRVRRTRDR